MTEKDQKLTFIVLKGIGGFFTPYILVLENNVSPISMSYRFSVRFGSLTVRFVTVRFATSGIRFGSGSVRFVSVSVRFWHGNEPNRTVGSTTFGGTGTPKKNSANDLKRISRPF